MGESFDGIYSGYLGSHKQVDNVLYFLNKFHGSDTIYLCDPIMGDNGKQFPIFTSGLLESMRTLCLNADVITPNLTELCLLCNVGFDALTAFAHDKDYENQIADMARGFMDKAARSQTVIVTGIITSDGYDTYIGNLVVSAKISHYIKTPYTGKSFSGTGDLFASVVAGCLVNGVPIDNAVKRAVDFLQPAIVEASVGCNDRNQGVYFEKYLNLLLN
jgi:pyridoxine kinase